MDVLDDFERDEMKIEIKSRYSGDALFSVEAKSLKIAIEMAVKQGANLEGANLRGADLIGADLRGADLEGAYLRGAYLRGAYLEGADLRGADLIGADLRGADLRGADLRDADLRDIKSDFFGRLTAAKQEVQGLYDYLIRGKINGSCYEGICACFCGTIANLRKENYENLSIDLKPDSDSPTEKWFLSIHEGDTEVSNQVVKITAEWMREFMQANDIAIPEYKLVSSFDNQELFANG